MGYYYQAPAQIEVYKTRATVIQGANKLRRIGFVTAITQANKEKAYRPFTVFFAKGEQAQKLIIVSLESGRLDTIYRVRAYLASLTAAARVTPIFQDLHLEGILTFFDLARMLGFEQVTVSDGDMFTHQIIFE